MSSASREFVICFGAVGLFTACALLGSDPPKTAGETAAELRKASVSACNAYEAGVALGAPREPTADKACDALHRVCDE